MRALRSIVTVSIAVAILASGCGRYARRAEGPAPTKTARYGAGIEVEDQRSPVPTTGRLTIRTRDKATGRPLEGVTVRIEGPQKRTLTSNRSGEISVTVQAGAYRLDLPRCGRLVIVDKTFEALVRVEAGSSALVEFELEQWARRFIPAESVEMSRQPSWGPGEDVRLGVRIDDVCDYSPEPGASVRAYAWRASSNLRILRTPLAADRTGFARVIVECIGEGDASLVIYDRARPEDQVDLLLVASAPENQTWCA